MNFANLIKDLMDAGLSQAEIGRKIDIKQPSVFDILHGNTKMMMWDKGNALIKLHKKVMRNK